MKLAIPARPRPVHADVIAAAARRTSRLGRTAGLALLVVTLAACGEPDPAGRNAAAPAAGEPAGAAPATPPGPPRMQELPAPGLRPVLFTDDRTLWGILRGRLASLALDGGRVEPTEHTAWSVAGGRRTVSWRNENGAWGMQPGEEPFRLAPTELMPGYDGPPNALWSPAGTRAILSWMAEWDAHHELLEPDGERRTLATFIEGYMLDIAGLWLDDRRVLFSMVAKAAVGAEPEYRESGWRGDLAVLDLDSDEFQQVTHVKDGEFLRPAGLLNGKVLVREHGADGVHGHWLYDPADWSRTSIDLPKGRSAAAGDAVVTYEEERTDQWRARLHALGTSTDLGIAADPDLPPSLSPDGRLIALRVLRAGKPVLLLIRR